MSPTRLLPAWVDYIPEGKCRDQDTVSLYLLAIEHQRDQALLKPARCQGALSGQRRVNEQDTEPFRSHDLTEQSPGGYLFSVAEIGPDKDNLSTFRNAFSSTGFGSTQGKGKFDSQEVWRCSTGFKTPRWPRGFLHMPSLNPEGPTVDLSDQ